MATTEEMENEILAEMAADPEAYSDGPVNDIILIDAESRTINVPASESLFGVEFDKDVERKYFKCPKIVGDNIDLSTHKIYISYITSDAKGMSYKGEPGLYYCEDMVADGDYITFSWLLSGNVFTNPGYIAFKVLAKFTDGENLKTRWNTTAAIGTVLMTVPDGDEIVERYPDIITQLLKRMDEVEAIATPEAMQNYVEAYLSENPPSGMTAAEKAQLNKNTNDISKLSSDKINKPLGGTEGQVLARDADGNVVWKDAMTELEDGAVTPKKTTFFFEETKNLNIFDQSGESGQHVSVAGLSNIYIRVHPSGSGCSNNEVAKYAISKIEFFDENDSSLSSVSAPMGVCTNADGVYTLTHNLDVPTNASYVVFSFNNYYMGGGWSTMIVTDHEITSDSESTQYNFEIVGKYKEAIAYEITETEAFDKKISEYVSESDSRTDEKISNLKDVSLSGSPISTGNILDYTDTVDGFVNWSESKGITYSNTQTWEAGMVSTKPLPVEGNTTYNRYNFSSLLETNNVNALLELDENMNVVKYTQSSSSIWPFTTQATTKYIIVSFRPEALPYIVISKNICNYYVPAIKKVVENNVYIPQNQIISGLSGIKWNAMGDSWTVDGKGTGYVARIAEKTGMIARNYGIVSSTISQMNDGGYEPMCVRYADMDDDAGLITVMGGINDHTSVITSIDYGEIDSTDTATFYGGWNVLLSGLRTKYPNAIILVFTNGDCTPETRGDAEGRVEAIQKVCAKHRIPCKDILHNLGYGYKEYQTDMVHLTDAQIERNLTPLVYNFILEHFMV